MAILKSINDFLYAGDPAYQANSLVAQQNKLKLQQDMAKQAAMSKLYGGIDPTSANGGNAPDGSPINWNPLQAPSGNATLMGNPGQAPQTMPTQQAAGLLGQSAPPSLLNGGPDQFDQQKTQLLRQANPDAFMSQDVLSATMGPRLRAAGMSPEQINAFMLDPKASGEALAKTAFPTMSDYARDLVAAGLKPGTQGFADAMKDKRAKETYIPEQDPLKRQQLAADIAEKYSSTKKNDAMTANLAGAALDDNAATLISQQLLAGDPSGLQGLGMGNVGAANKAKVRNIFTQMATASGLSGQDIAAKNAQFFGEKAAQRVIGTQGGKMDMLAIESDKFADLALQASDAVPRGSFVPLTKVEQMVQSGTSSPEMAAFAAANTSLVNAYSAIAGRGTPTVSGQEHAYKILSTAQSPTAYKAAVDQLRKEMKAAQASPRQASADRAATISGGTSQPNMLQTPQAPAAPNPQAVADELRRRGVIK